MTADDVKARDLFAAAALQGMLAKHGLYATKPVMARDAYQQADAMMAERAKPLPNGR